MADQVLAEWTDEEMLVDPDELPECHQFEGPMQTLIDWAGPLEGKTVLETGSGFGTLSCWLAMNGARVIATDISPKCLEVVEERARRNGVADRITTINTPVETLEESTTRVSTSCSVARSRTTSNFPHRQRACIGYSSRAAGRCSPSR
ncbi:MAG: methyltransferase domain-containing protein [Candidatus Microthrix sp.]|nr:methyltransferase domain-containing protein [Candidatus Microthrix sp.]